MSYFKNFSEILKRNSKISYFIIIILFILLALSRFYLIEHSARFIWDESSDLVRMHNIWVDKKITLIGPEFNNIKIFGSLTYYMLLPFAVLLNFNPIGPVIGTGFFNILIILMLLLILIKKFKWKIYYALPLLIVIYPLLQAGRWAWNPYLVPFWEALALLVYYFFKNSWYKWTLIGLLMGLGIHNHWYAVFADIGLFLSFIVLSIKNKDVKPALFYAIGMFLAISPFIIFDITHSPGLFITRMIDFSTLSPKQGAFNLTTILFRFLTLPYEFIFYFVQNTVIAVILEILFLIYIFYKFNFERLFLLLPIIFQIVGLSLISTTVNGYYFLPAVIFFILIISMKQGSYLKLQKILLITLFIFSIFPSISEIYKNDWSTNIQRDNSIVNLIAKNMGNRNCNIFVPASTDTDGLGKKYRDLLSLKNINLPGIDQYSNYSCIFIITTGTVNDVHNSPNYEVNLIRKLNPVRMWKIDNQWYVFEYQISKS